MTRFNLTIVGSGAAAFAGAIRATELGKSVAMVESRLVGGTCVNVGCVPSKHLLHVSDQRYYYDGEVRPRDFPRIIHNKDRLVHTLRRQKYVDVLRSRPNIKLYKGRGRFLSESELEVGDKVIESEDFLIATGSSPQTVPVEGLEEAGYVTSAEALSLKKRPKSLIVIGGGFVGLEIGQLYRHFGTEVTVLEKMPQILPGEEPEVAECLQSCLENEGMRIFTSTDLEQVEKEEGSKVVRAKKGRKTILARSEELLLSVGRKPNTSDLGLERTGVIIDGRGAVEVDAEMKTTAENIWAAGDVTGRVMLETTAAKEGRIAAENALAEAHRKMDLEAVPHAVFTNPQVASVGLTDQEAVKRGFGCNCRTVDMAIVPKSAIVDDTRGLIKMVIDNKTKRVLGVHIVSPLAADIIHEAVMAVKFKLTTDDIIDTVHVFPTFSEAIKLVAESFTRDIGNISCCIE